MVVALAGAHPPRDAGADPRAHHVRGEHPAEDHAGVGEPEVAAAQGNRGRHGRDPVQAVEHDEHPHAGLDAGGEHGIQREQRDAAAAVVGDEQPAGVDPVGEPARGDGAGDVEDADHGEQAGGGRARHPVVVGGRARSGSG